MISAPRQHLPRGEDFLLLPPSIQPYAYRIVDKLFAHRAVRRGATVSELPRGQEIAPRYLADGTEHDVGSFMDRNAIVGLHIEKLQGAKFICARALCASAWWSTTAGRPCRR